LDWYWRWRACGDGDSPAADAAVVGGGIDSPGCPKVWLVRGDTGATAGVGAGALTLSASNIDEGSAIEVYQGGLTGDFTTSFTDSLYVAGRAGSIRRGAEVPPAAVRSSPIA
jgi:hypothetical protein